MVNWFGPEAWGAPICTDSPRCETPVGAACLHCGETIREGDCGVTMPFVDGGAAAKACALHLDCHLRTFVGSVGHQQGRCSCTGVTDDCGDPPDMTKREAATAAVRLFTANQQNECVCRTTGCGHRASSHIGGVCRECGRVGCWY